MRNTILYFLSFIFNKFEFKVSIFTKFKTKSPKVELNLESKKELTKTEKSLDIKELKFKSLLKLESDCNIILVRYSNAESNVLFY